MGMTTRSDHDPTSMGAGDAASEAARDRHPGTDPDRIEVFFERVERSVPPRFGPPKLVRAMVRLAAVPLLMLVLLGIVAIVRTDMLPETFARLGTLLFIGKLAAIGGQEEFVYWAIVLGTSDVLYGMFFVLNFDLLKDIPYVGRWVHRTLDRTVEMVQRRPSLRRVSLLGVAAIVSVPVHGTGTITGALMGRILGLGPTRTLGALAIGSYVGVVIVLLGSFAAVTLIAGGAGLLLIAFGALLAAAWVVIQHRMDAKADRADQEERTAREAGTHEATDTDDGAGASPDGTGLPRGRSGRRRFPAG